MWSRRYSAPVCLRITELAISCTPGDCTRWACGRDEGSGAPSSPSPRPTRTLPGYTLRAAYPSHSCRARYSPENINKLEHGYCGSYNVLFRWTGTSYSLWRPGKNVRRRTREKLVQRFEFQTRRSFLSKTSSVRINITLFNMQLFLVKAVSLNSKRF